VLPSLQFAWAAAPPRRALAGPIMHAAATATALPLRRPRPPRAGGGGGAAWGPPPPARGVRPPPCVRCRVAAPAARERLAAADADEWAPVEPRAPAAAPTPPRQQRQRPPTATTTAAPGAAARAAAKAAAKAADPAAGGGGSAPRPERLERLPGGGAAMRIYGGMEPGCVAQSVSTALAQRRWLRLQLAGRLPAYALMRGLALANAGLAPAGGAAFCQHIGRSAAHLKLPSGRSFAYDAVIAHGPHPGGGGGGDPARGAATAAAGAGTLESSRPRAFATGPGSPASEGGGRHRRVYEDHAHALADALVAAVAGPAGGMRLLAGDGELVTVFEALALAERRLRQEGAPHGLEVHVAPEGDDGAAEPPPATRGRRPVVLPPRPAAARAPQPAAPPPLPRPPARSRSRMRGSVVVLVRRHAAPPPGDGDGGGGSGGEGPPAAAP